VGVVVWVLVGAWAAWAAVRLLGVERGWVPVCAMAFTPYAAASAPVPVLVALATGRWLAAGVAVAALVVLAAAVLPRALGRPETAEGPVVRVLTCNLLHGEADPEPLVELVREHRVDLLALQEYTQLAEKKLRAAGLGRLLGYRAAAPRWEGKGSALYSRYPLAVAEPRINPGGYRNARATVQVPGFGALPVESAHPAAPYAAHQVPDWRAGLASQPPATPAGEIRLLLGDLNATLDHAPLRALLRTGYRDAARVVGRGLVPTWPYTGYGRIPRVTLDHVLADRRVKVRAVAAYRIPGSDHRALYAELVFPAAGGATAGGAAAGGATAGRARR
jgi:endonuclease/exonuclease/phosphatase (EEP) superfamily protein YafD